MLLYTLPRSTQKIVFKNVFAVYMGVWLGYLNFLFLYSYKNITIWTYSSSKGHNKNKKGVNEHNVKMFKAVKPLAISVVIKFQNNVHSAIQGI